MLIALPAACYNTYITPWCSKLSQKVTDNTRHQALPKRNGVFLSYLQRIVQLLL